jgi:cytochrome c oxidase cbb3-type subunit 4
VEANTLQAGAAIDMGFVRGVITLLTFGVFLGIVGWAYHRGNRERFEDDALLPFVEDDGVAMVDREGEEEQ